MHSRGDKNLDLEYNKGILFIRFRKSINKELAKEINQYLIPKVLEQKIKYIVLNLYNVESVDQFGLDSLLNLKCAVKTNKGKICLCEISKELSKKINLVKLRRINSEMQAFDIIGAM